MQQKQYVQRFFRRATLRVAFLILPLFLFAATASHAQVLYGTITGNVTDPSGAVIPDAQVKVNEIATGVSRNAVTNAEGVYTLRNLNPGTYSIKITAASFAGFEQQQIALSTNATVRVDAVLKIGENSTSVDVTTAPPLLTTDKADVSYTIGQKQIAELPTAGSTGRNVQNLYALVPGSTPPAEQNSAAGNPQRSVSVNVNGVTNGSNSVRIDGAMDIHPRLSYLVAYVPPTDALESINVVTNSFNAEQGSAGGAAINMVIRSGTNQFHGSAWAYNSIAQFNAQSWSNRTGVRQKNILNEDGGNLGGPIIRNKLFFFVDYDRITTNKNSNGILSVPTQTMRNGDFSSFLTLTSGCTPAQPGKCTFIYDPVTGTSTGTGKSVFPGNVIPPNRIAPAAAKLLAVLPLPNYGPTGALLSNYFASQVVTFERQNIDSKITYIPSDRMTVFGHYSISPGLIRDPSPFGKNPGGAPVDGGQPNDSASRIQNIGVGATYAVTPHFLIDSNGGYTRQRAGAQANDVSLGDYGRNELGIPGTNNNGQINYAGIPAFTFNSYTSLGNATNGPFLYRENEYTGNLNATWAKGSHSYRFGGEYLHIAINDFQVSSSARGSFAFNGGATAPSGGSFSPTTSFADFLLGQAQTYTKGIQTFNPAAMRYSTFSFYGQDTWQATKALTVNYGARYEYYPLPVYDHFGTVRYDPSVRSTVTDSLGTHTVGTVIIGGKGGNDQHAGTNNGWGRIVPRLGLSYRVTERTVIRAGGGITVDSDAFRGLTQAYPSLVTNSLSGANSYVAATSLNPGLLSTTTQVGIPSVPVPVIDSGFVPLPASVSTATIPKDVRRGYIETWNLAIQQELPANFVSTITYVGTHVIRQQTNWDINASTPGAGQAGRLLDVTYGANTSNTEIYSYAPLAGA